MKKTLIVSLSALALMLAGCGNQAENQAQASSDKVSTSEKKQAQTKKASSTSSGLNDRATCCQGSRDL